MKRLIYILLAVFLCVNSVCIAASNTRSAELVNITGNVYVERDGKKIPVKTAMDLKVGDTIVTDQGSATLLIDGGNTGKAFIEPSTRIDLDKLIYDTRFNRKNTVLTVAVGNVLVQAAKLKGADGFEVRTPTSIVGVRGTLFKVSVSKEDQK